MFEITIKGETLSQLAGNILLMARQYQATVSYEADDAVREELQAKRTRAKKAAPAPEPEVEETDAELEAELEAELNAPVPSAPDTAKPGVVVDAGTGKPLPADDQPVKMTFDDVKASAAKLAAKDVEQLKLILSKYGAGKISEVPKAKLGDFASDVLEALG